ncbi:LysR family transcriptional regulator [Nocardioides litoris]|uniref:LysR family transcriptional regulator n=1 Tax=Nocardioides litoris TaxID=1926648 RepID=UPI0011239D1E|nr:LysR family transcriptional regulator [Nocardioides litoris]
METRELRYFVAVAEEGHVGRAAQRLGMTQPPLSRAIARLERRLGAELLVRTPRGVEPTEAGAVLLVEGRAALAAVDAAERRTRRAAGSGTVRPSVVLAAKAGASAELLAKLLDAHAAEPDAPEVDLLLCAPGEQADALRDGRADVALLHLPFDDTGGLDHEEVGQEGQVLVAPSGHPVTARRSVVLADLADLGVPVWPGPDLDVPDPARLLQLVGLGRAVAVLPESVRGGLPGGVAAVPVLDAPTVTTVVAWPQHSRSVGVAGLVRVATRL